MVSTHTYNHSLLPIKGWNWEEAPYDVSHPAPQIAVADHSLSAPTIPVPIATAEILPEHTTPSPL